MAEKQGKSINQLIPDFIKENIGLEKEKKHTREYHDLDDLFGTWTEEEFKQIQDLIDESHQIDPERWQ